MKKLLSLLVVFSIVTSSLCISYFAAENEKQISNILNSNETNALDDVTTKPTAESSVISSTMPSKSDKIYVNSITLNKSNYTLYNGKNFTLKTTVTPKNATNKTLTWKTSNKNIATVDNNGKIVAKGKGTCNIIVSATDGSNVKATCKVTVKQYVTSVKINKSTALIKKKSKTTTLKAIVYPTNADNKKVTWSIGKSYKKNISVNSKGVVKALKNNTFGWVYATAKDGSKKSVKCLVIVGNRANKVQIGKYTKKKFTQLNSLKLNLNKTYNLKKKVSNTTTKKKKTIVKKVAYTGVTWKSSNSKVVSVNSNGKIKALKYGSATIIATTMDGSKKIAKCTVTVPKYVSKITFDKNNKSGVGIDKSFKLKVTITPKDATNKKLKWISSDDTVATVDNTGKVKCVGVGPAIITASATDGSGVKATYKVVTNVTMDTKMNTLEFVSDKKYINMYVKELTKYFASCGAVINPNMVGTSQYCNLMDSNYYDDHSINDFIVTTVGHWTWRRAQDEVNNNGEWKNLKPGKSLENFLALIDDISFPNSKNYNPKKVLDANWNGWKQMCKYDTSDRIVNIYVEAIQSNSGNHYEFRMYWDTNWGLKHKGIPLVKE